MDPRIFALKRQFSGIVDDMAKKKKDISPEAALLGLIASLLFVLVEQGEEVKIRNEIATTEAKVGGF